MYVCRSEINDPGQGLALHSLWLTGRAGLTAEHDETTPSDRDHIDFPFHTSICLHCPSPRNVQQSFALLLERTRISGY